MNGDRNLILALHMAASRSPLAVELDIAPDVIPLVLEAATCFIVLEAIANVAKHARATNVKVKVWVENQRVVTEIEDDGIGGATHLRKLKDRARAAGGTMEIDSPPGIGTLIRAEVPFTAQRSS
jgi:signal transduction histidine kinase